MINTLIVMGFFVWYFLALGISETLGKKRKIGEEWSFFWCMLLSPVIGYFITKYNPKIN